MDEEERNYCSLVLLLSRVGLVKLRQYFIDKWNSVGGFLPWTDCPQNGADLLTKFTPLAYEKDKVKSGDTSTWDLSLFVKALLNSKPPFVPKSKKGLVSGLKFLKETRNTLCHTASGRIETPEFHKLYSETCNSLMLVGATSKDFKKVKKDVQQPWNELLSLVKHCATQDKDILQGVDTINDRLDQLQKELEEIKHTQQQSQQKQEKIMQGQSSLQHGQSSLQQGQSSLQQGQSGLQQGQSGLQQGQSGLQQGQSSLQQGQKEILKSMESLQKPSTSHEKLSNISIEDVLSYSEKLRTSTKSQTEFQPKLMASHSVQSIRTDEIFTNIMIQRGRKPLKKITPFNRWEQLAEYNRPSQSSINRCQDIFMNTEKNKPNPKSILVIGKPGIGKSLFCQRIARDWADGVLFDNDASDTKPANDFDFVYLMTFRQLNLFGNEKLNFCDVLNHCSVVDEHSSINESLFEYVLEHPEKVFFILDGYDEYSKREEIYDSKFEQKYQNNPRLQMPVPVLISKVLRKKIFGNAVVMVTSRPDEADEIGGIKMDAVVEIAGFSVEQVKEFIGKYFQSKHEEMKTAALDHIMNNENLLSIAHIPVMCYLMCWCLEWHIEFKIEKDLPATITELYSEVVEIFELKHHCKSEYRTREIPQSYSVPLVVKSTVEKLSELASATYEENKFIFNETDIEKFNLTCQEMENLKSSGLITCGPSFRISPFKMARDFCFSHMTLHEYFAALGFTNNGKIPTLQLQVHANEMVFQFCAGLLSRLEGGERLMADLLNMLILFRQPRCKLLIAKFLYEFGDKAFGERMIKKYHPQFCDEEGYLFRDKSFGCYDSPIFDCVSLSFFLDLVSGFCKNNKDYVESSSRPFQINGLNCYVNTVQGMEQVVKSLKNVCCPITALDCCSGDDKAVSCLVEALPSTHITTLSLWGPGFTDEGLSSLISALPSTHITTLDLEGSFTDYGLNSLSTALPSTHITTLKLTGNCCTNEGLFFLIKALPSIRITTLQLATEGLSDEVFSYLSAVLPSTHITKLKLSGDDFTDEGMSSLRTALQSTHITKLHLSGDGVTDEGLSLLSLVLPSTRINTLHLGGNGFVNEGLSSLSTALPSTHITTLKLCGEGFTDGGVSFLSAALPSTHIAKLHLWGGDGFTDEGLSSLSSVLPSTHITTLHLEGGYFTDDGLSSLSTALPSTHITTLQLTFNSFTDEGLPSLITVLPLTHITTLNLVGNNFTDVGIQQLKESAQLIKVLHSVYL